MTQDEDMCTQCTFWPEPTQGFARRETQGSVFAAEFQSGRWCSGEQVTTKFRKQCQALVRHVDGG